MEMKELFRSLANKIRISNAQLTVQGFSLSFSSLRYFNEELSREIVTVLAEKLLLGAHEFDADGLAAICRVIGKVGDAQLRRYLLYYTGESAP